jgi:hypothetical protein
MRGGLIVWGGDCVNERVCALALTIALALNTHIAGMVRGSELDASPAVAQQVRALLGGVMGPIYYVLLKRIVLIRDIVRVMYTEVLPS